MPIWRAECRGCSKTVERESNDFLHPHRRATKDTMLCLHHLPPTENKSGMARENRDLEMGKRIGDECVLFDVLGMDIALLEILLPEML